MKSPEDIQFYENNKKAIEERLAMRKEANVPAVTPQQEVALKEDLKRYSRL